MRRSGLGRKATRRRTDDRSRPDGGRERDAARTHLRVERGEPAHQREPRPADCAGRGRGERAGAHRRTLRRHHHHRRGRRTRGLRHLGLHRRRAPLAGGMARRAAAVRVFPRSAGAATAGGRARLRALARLLAGPAAVAGLPGHADALPGRTCRQLLPGGKGGRGGVHGRGRGGPGAVRLAGRDGDRQRAHLPRRAARPGRPRGPGRDLAGRRRRVRCAHRRPGLAQPRGQAYRREPVQLRPVGGAVARGSHLSTRGRARVRPGSTAAGAGAGQRRDGAGRGDRALGPGRAQRHDAHQRHPDPRPRRRTRLSGGHLAGPGAATRSSSACGRSSWAW